MTRWWLGALGWMACQPGPARLADGTVVALGEGGEVVLRKEGQVLPLFAPQQPLTWVEATETWQAPVGIWSFEREVTSVTPVAGTPTLVMEGEDVVVRYDEGATLRVTQDGPGRTRISFAIPEDVVVDGTRLSFRCEAGGTFHGWGEQYHATDQRGEAFDLIVGEQGIGRTGEPFFLTGDAHTTYFPMPYWLDARGFGVLFETDRRTLVDLCASDEAVATVEMTGPTPGDMVIFHGPTPADVLRGLGDYLGRPPAPPDWAWSLWVASQGGAQDVRDDVAALVAADIPFSAVWVQDWTGIRRNFSGGFGVEYRWVEDPALYPDLAGLVDELHADGIRFLAYANPFIDHELEDHFPEMAERDLLLKNEAGEPYVFLAPNGQSAHPDLTLDAARDYVKSYLRRMVEDLGFDGWMVDFSEWTPLDAVVADGTPGASYHNRFPEDWQRVTREVLEDTRPDGDWVSFARAGWTGVQDVSLIHWIGDQEATWAPEDGLPTVVPAMINLGLVGVPFVTHDIAGFSGGPSSKELYLRWSELGAFTPVMRTHEGDNRDSNWRWNSDEETVAHVRRFSRVHEALAPHMARWAREAAVSSMPLVQHMMLAFPEDEATWSLSDQYMLGGELLVAPVVSQGATSRELYLPEGDWVHVWTGETYAGGRMLTVDAPVGAPPVFGRGQDWAELRAVE